MNNIKSKIAGGKKANKKTASTQKPLKEKTRRTHEVINRIFGLGMKGGYIVTFKRLNGHSITATRLILDMRITSRFFFRCKCTAVFVIMCIITAFFLKKIFEPFFDRFFGSCEHSRCAYLGANIAIFICLHNLRTFFLNYLCKKNSSTYFIRCCRVAKA